jgi:hypothetical protein
MDEGLILLQLGMVRWEKVCQNMGRPTTQASPSDSYGYGSYVPRPDSKLMYGRDTATAPSRIQPATADPGDTLRHTRGLPDRGLRTPGNEMALQRVAMQKAQQRQKEIDYQAEIDELKRQKRAAQQQKVGKRLGLTGGSANGGYFVPDVVGKQRAIEYSLARTRGSPSPYSSPPTGGRRSAVPSSRGGPSKHRDHHRQASPPLLRPEVPCTLLPVPLMDLSKLPAMEL